MIRPAATMAAAVTTLVGLAIYPFLPGPFDPMAGPLATAAQLVTVAAVPLVPVGLLWLAALMRDRQPGGPAPARTRRFALAAVVVGGVTLVPSVAIAVLALGPVIGVAIGAAIVAAFRVIRPALRRDPPLAPTPTARIAAGLVVIPAVSLALQLAIAGPLTRASRNRAMSGSADLIAGLERFRAERGEYPPTMDGLWKDYGVGVVGIDRYRFVRHGEAYTLAFEQPRFLFDRVGTQEVVVYHPSGAHLFPSHASWFLRWPPDLLAGRQGWYEAHDAGPANWRYFWFD